MRSVDIQARLGSQGVVETGDDPYSIKSATARAEAKPDRAVVPFDVDLDTGRFKVVKEEVVISEPPQEVRILRYQDWWSILTVSAAEAPSSGPSCRGRYAALRKGVWILGLRGANGRK